MKIENEIIVLFDVPALFTSIDPELGMVLTLFNNQRKHLQNHPKTQKSVAMHATQSVSLFIVALPIVVFTLVENVECSIWLPKY